MSPALWTAVGVVGAAGAALAGWHMHRRQMPALRALDADFQCPDMRFRYTPQELFDGLDRLGAQGRALLLRFWLADAGFAVALLAVTLAAARNSMPDLSPLRMVMDAAACLRTLADLVENALLVRAVREAGATPENGAVIVGQGDVRMALCDDGMDGDALWH